MKRFILAITFLLLACTRVEAAGAVNDCSSVITLGGTAQVLVGANTVTSYLTVQNVSSGNLGIGLTSSPVIGGAGTIVLGPGSAFTFENSFIGNNALWIIGPNTSQAYTCWRN